MIFSATSCLGASLRRLKTGALRKKGHEIRKDLKRRSNEASARRNERRKKFLISDDAGMLNFRLECIKNCCLLRNEIFDFVFFFLSSKAIHCATSCISFDGVRELARYTFRLYVRLIVFYIYRLSLTWSASIRRLGQLRMTGWNKEKKPSSRLVADCMEPKHTWSLIEAQP